ncbi:MAG: Ppx/GppA family phosphatase [Rhizobiaceae bacterium]|nr:Ppx/GppA family phosphatase [Rhizobiaceae bacterium]
MTRQNDSSNLKAANRKLLNPTLNNQKSSNTEPVSERAQGRLKARIPVAVIDIGSNSVRQVIYEGLTRAPAVLFNEKVLCGLGKGLADSNRLNEGAIECSLNAIRRFRALGRQVGVSKTYILATAAARDAKNGQQFVEAVEEICDCEVEVLTGKMEARYSANGIVSGFFDPDGIVGDMGGGSLELATVGGELFQGQTFALGGLRLRDLSGEDLKLAREITIASLVKCKIKWPGKRKDFYAVGGTWRSLAKLHINHNNYPLQVIHNYPIGAEDFVQFCDAVSTSDIEEISGIESVSRNRRNLLQYGAIVLSETLKHLGAKRVLMSSLGVREGYLYSQLPHEERTKDMLLEAAWDLAILRARCPAHSEELAHWSGEAFRALGIEENRDERRFRVAACYLADIGWRAHPDYRAAQSLGIISNAGFVGLSHEGRAYLSLANFHRYQGLGPRVEIPSIAALAGKRVTRRARILAALFRVGYLYSASSPGVLPRINFSKSGDGIVMELPADIADLRGERPDLRLRQLGREVGVAIGSRVVSTSK